MIDSLFQNVCAAVDAIEPEVRDFRRTLHQFPETAFEEVETARRIVDFLGDMAGARVETGIAKTGIVVTFGADLPGPCVALRADMDALPMHEESGVAWQSRIPGRAHACGHDGHVAMLAGTARVLARLQGSLQGPVKLIFQPAEEGGGGGRVMCEAGVLQSPKVDAIYGLHNNLPGPSVKLGSIAYVDGAAMAGTGTFRIRVIGKGGHAAFPHLCSDPIVVASAIVTQLQTIVARHVDPLAAAVVSVTTFNAGSALNIIPPHAVLSGTFRALDKQLLQRLAARIQVLAESVAAAHGAAIEIDCHTGYPPLVNHPRAFDTFARILESVGYADQLLAVPPIMGGEDFAFFCEQVPGFFYFLPACPVGVDAVPMCHHPAFDFNDDLLPVGMRLHLLTALRFADYWKAELT